MRRFVMVAMLLLLPLPTVAGPAVVPATTMRAAGVQDGSVEVRLGVIHATKRATGHVDARLGVLARYLDGFVENDFRLVSSHRARLSAVGSRSIDVPGNRRVSMELLGSDASRVRVRVTIERGDGGTLVDTTATIPRGRSMMLAGPRFGDGILVLPITVVR